MKGYLIQGKAAEDKNAAMRKIDLRAGTIFGFIDYTI